MTRSPFLDRPSTDHVASNALAFALRDAFPVSQGHTLVIPRRLVATWFDATEDEQHALLALVGVVKQRLDAAYHPDGYNVGFNAGAAAGQTVPHLHLHVIPRYTGDVADPRGGIRAVIPGKGSYPAPPAHLAVGGENDPFARHVLPLLECAQAVDIVAAFVQDSGLDRIASALDTALRSGAQVRLITGDYLAITQVAALERLLDWQSARDEDLRGRLETRVIEVDRLPGRTRTFHPKAWRLRGAGFDVVFVGSSNLSHAALTTGIEWNLRADATSQPAAVDRVALAFESLWQQARPLDAAWVEAYARRTRDHAVPIPAGEIDLGALPPVVDPHDVQREALASLRAARAEGRRRALVVLATGLGKTWLAAFDYAQLWDELGRQPRLLFVAHRRELLFQAARTYRRLVHDRGGDARIGWFVEEHAALDAPLVFASVAKLARASWLERLAQQRFDYVVIDEVHHAAADSYRRILAQVDPPFLLGLTATPDRADAADIEGHFDDFTAYRADIARGIDLGRLVPFRYFGVKDDIDYEHLPWRNRHFDPDELAKAVQTEARMQTLWSAWNAHPARRTLVFCCSIAHATYVTAWLRAQGLHVAKVYAAPGSDDRDDSLAELAAGTLDALCAVDVFNEGVDVPTLDRVVMLRPTESRVVYLQQLGRGLRAAPDKTHLTIIDFVGNHHVFIDRLRALLSLAGTGEAARLARLLEAGHLELPDGCSVHLELEAKTALEQRFRLGGTDEVERAYRQLRDARDPGDRPTAGELFRLGYGLDGIRRRHGSWLALVASEGDLSPDQLAAFDAARAFLDDLELTSMSRSFKMITLQVLLDADALHSGLPVPTIAARSWSLLARSPELLSDVPERERPDDPTSPAWLAYWQKNPIAAWTSKKKRERTWFHVDANDRLVLDLPPSPGLASLVRELVDLRLAKYRRRTAALPDSFLCRVLWNKSDPILKLPAGPPRVKTHARLEDGTLWTFHFKKEFCNVAHPPGAASNQLPDLLRRWFGPRAGHPGTTFDVRFRSSPDGLLVEPIQTDAVPHPPIRAIRAYPDLRAAAGHTTTDPSPPDSTRVWFPIDAPTPDHFAVRISGTSMDGGKTPLRDGDWAIFQLARQLPASSVENRVVLVQVPNLPEASAYQVKRLTRTPQGLQLTSDNPAGPTFPATASMVVIARFVRLVRPEELAPPPAP